MFQAHKMVTKTQFPIKSHHDITLVPLNTCQQIKSWSPPDHTTMTKSGQQTAPPLTVADFAGKGKTSEAPPQPLNSLTAYKGSGGNEKLPPCRISTVGIVWKVLSTRTQLTHKHHHHGGAVCPSSGVVSLDTPDQTRVTSSGGVGRGQVHWV